MPLHDDENNDKTVRLTWRPYANLSAASEAVTTDITFHVVLRRKTLFYLTNIILPIMIISFLSVFMFHLPAESKVQNYYRVTCLTKQNLGRKNASVKAVYKSRKG